MIIHSLLRIVNGNQKKTMSAKHADTDTNQQVILLTITKYAKIGNNL